MKIIHLIDECYAGGGAEQYLWDLFDELTDLNITNYVLSVKKSTPTDIWGDGNNQSQRVIFPEEECNFALERMKDIDPDLFFVHNLSDWRWLQGLRKPLPYVCYGHDYRPFCLGYRYYLGQPCQKIHGWRCMGGVLSHCLDYHPRNLWHAYTATSRAGRYFRKARMVFVASPHMEREYRRAGLSSCLMPYFLREEAFNLLRVEEFPADRERPILFVGRLVPVKGLGQLLAYADKLKSELWVVGDGWERPGLEQRAATYGSKVRFWGWQRRDMVRKLLRRAAVAVFPSLWPEPFGRVGLEAMAMETPVVAFDVGGISSWLEHEKAGYLIPPYHWGQFISAVNSLLENPKKAREMGEYGRTMVRQRFNARHHVEKMLGYLTEVAGR